MNGNNNNNNNNNNNSTNHSSHVHVVRDVPGRPDLTLHFSIVVPPGQNSSQIDNRFISAISRSLVQRLPTLLNDNGSPTGMLFGATVRPLNRSGDGDNSRTPSNNSASASQSENSSGSGRGINSSRVRLTPNLLLPHGGFAEWMDQLFNNAESRPKPADADAIATLPTGKPTIAQLQAKAECCICKDLFVELDIGTTLPCDHFFHKECVETWLGRSHTCPLCRFELPVAKEPVPSSSSAPPLQQQQQQQSSSSSSSNNMPNVNASGAFAVPVMPPSFLPLHALFQHLAQSIRARTAEAVDSPAPRQSRNSNNNTSSSNTALRRAVSSNDIMTRSRNRRSSSISNSRSATTAAAAAAAAADTSNDAVAAASPSVRRTRVRRRRSRVRRGTPLPIRPLPPIVSSSIPPPLPTRNQSSSSSSSSTTTTNQSSAPVSSRTRRRQTTSQQSRKRSRL